MIDLARSADEAVRLRLAAHPRVAKVEPMEIDGLEFHQGDWVRMIVDSDPRCELFGLVELMDNNPLVCADRASVPSPIGTLMLVALGPLASAGLLMEKPAVMANGDDDPEVLAELLRREGYFGGVAFAPAELDLQGALAVSAMAVVRAPKNLEDLDALYDERFGKAFFIRCIDEGEWDVALVKGQPFAAYRLQVTPVDDDVCLLTIRVLADLDGKVGIDRFLHCMNVMAGLEESLGIA